MLEAAIVRLVVSEVVLSSYTSAKSLRIQVGVGRWCLCNSHHSTPFLLPHPSYVALLLRGAEVLIVA
jgi:hypothetical protein